MITNVPKLLGGVVIVLFLTPNYIGGNLLEPYCGNPRLVAGNPDDAEKYPSPWLVMVMGKHRCSGSLIRSNMVLTSVNCAAVKPLPRVRLGTYDQTISRNCNGDQCQPETIEVDSIELNQHPGISDIALLRLAPYDRKSVFLIPICLLVHGEVDDIANLKGTGWNMADIGNSRIKSMINVKRSICSLCTPNKIDNSHLCVVSGIRSSNNETLGSPLSGTQAYGGYNREIQVGILSYELENCKGFSVYTNVLNYMNWIVATIEISDIYYLDYDY